MTIGGDKILNYGRHEIDAADVEAVVEVLKSDFITSGPVIEKFEFELGQYLNNQNIVVCSNGTSALYLASKVLEIGQNDVVIVPSQTFLATASVPHMLGAEVVFSDVDPKTGLMRASCLNDRKKITEDGEYNYHNLTLINLVLQIFGPMREDKLCIYLLILQIFCCGLGLMVRYGVAGYIY